MATIKLNRRQRDAIYGELVSDLSGTGDIRINLDNEDYEAARRHRRRYEEDMRLLDDLGWEPDQDRDEFEITMDHDDLARVLRRVNRSAGETLHIYVVEPLEGEFVTRAANTQAAVGDAFAQIAGVEDDDERPSGDNTDDTDGDR
ncbi:MAG: hypothetical protein WD993_06410 [Thermoleophilaceae bacterium]